jgi:hypothetical protein
MQRCNRGGKYSLWLGSQGEGRRFLHQDEKVEQLTFRNVNRGRRKHRHGQVGKRDCMRAVDMRSHIAQGLGQCQTTHWLVLEFKLRCGTWTWMVTRCLDNVRLGQIVLHRRPGSKIQSDNTRAAVSETRSATLVNSRRLRIFPEVHNLLFPGSHWLQDMASRKTNPS